MAKHTNQQLHKDFDLERLILFSDAVFAIAITLLIIEIKFPETPENLHEVSFFTLFKPTIIQYLGFVLSFFFIGGFWAKHLRLFRLLIAYDSGVITLNLTFLFFIVSFPFTASGITEHIHPGYLAPIYFYIANVGLVCLAKCLLCYYVFYKKPHLTLPGHDAEKRFIFKQTLFTLYMIIWVLVLITLSKLLSEELMPYCFLTIPFVAIFNKKRLSKLKKAMREEQQKTEEATEAIAEPGNTYKPAGES